MQDEIPLVLYASPLSRYCCLWDVSCFMSWWMFHVGEEERPTMPGDHHKKDAFMDAFISYRRCVDRRCVDCIGVFIVLIFARVPVRVSGFCSHKSEILASFAILR